MRTLILDIMEEDEDVLRLIGRTVFLKFKWE